MGTTRICIERAEYVGGLVLHLFFSDGTSRQVDFEPFILANPHPQYNRYIDPRNFKKFTIENGNVVWGKNWDMIFPLMQLYNGIVAWRINTDLKSAYVGKRHRRSNHLDEAASAYKNIDEVMANQQDLVKIITKLSPLAVVKG